MKRNNKKSNLERLRKQNTSRNTAHFNIRSETNIHTCIRVDIKYWHSARLAFEKEMVLFVAEGFLYLISWKKNLRNAQIKITNSVPFHTISNNKRIKTKALFRSCYRSTRVGNVNQLWIIFCFGRNQAIRVEPWLN